MRGYALTLAGAEVADGGRRILGPLDLSLPPDGVTVVMGANGAGKSLALRLAHGLIAPRAGQVLWDGQPAAASMRARGFVFQATPVLRRSVAANLAFPLLAQAVPGPERRRRVAEALDEVRLAHAAARPAAQLSGGERQRMAFARAMIARPRALLMDEPSASLDPASTAALEALIQAVAARGVKVVMATHDIGQAAPAWGDVVFLAAGRLAEAGPAAHFFAGPRSEAAQRYLEGVL